MTKAKILNDGGFYERLDGVEFPLEVECRVEGDFAKVRDDTLVKAGVRKCAMTGPNYEWNFLLNSEAEIIESDQLDAHLGIESKVEWKNGDECYHENDHGDDCLIFIGMGGVENSSMCHVEHFDGEYVNSYYLPVSELSKTRPETTEQREERERLEAAYELYCTQCQSSGVNPLPINVYEDCGLVKPWLAIVDKTNYRKS